ncbi:MAG: EAL domain-containing protein [Cyanobacteria bacterium P01_D01_bin.36]
MHTTPYMLKRSIHSKPLLIIREAFTSLLPIVLVMNILVLLSGLTSLLDGWGLTGIAAFNGNEVNRLYHFLIPLFLNLSLSTLLAKEKELEQVGTLLISMVCYFRVTGFLSISENSDIISHNSSLLTSLPCTWFALSLLHYLSGISKLRLVDRQKDISPRLQKTLNLIVPGLLCVLCFEVIGQLIHWFISSTILSQLTQTLPDLQQLNAIPELILYKAISQTTWFIGLHGEHSAEGLFHLLKVFPAGETSPFQLKAFHDVFMNIGGSGSTFAIPILILLTNRTNQFKSIARLSLPFSFFNVNEILLFGLPILLNPIFLIPFLLVPFVNMVIALTAINLGIFTITTESLHWMSAPVYSAYMLTGGSIGAVITQLICIFVDGCIYLPFLVLANNQYQAPLYLLKLFGEDAYSFVNEEINHRQERLFISQQRSMMASMSATQQVLQQLQNGKFILYFQPKVDATSLKLVGLEALLRFQNRKGDILPPTFLPILYKQGLSQVIDTKVVDLAFEQILKWRDMDLAVPPIAINFDKDFLLDGKAVKAFIARAKHHNIYFYIEITEHTYTVEVEALAAVVSQLQEAGHRISIDDFGAGYSSLTTLLTLKANEIKLDRQLALAPELEAGRGSILLATSVQLCHDLGFSVVAEGVETEAQLQMVRRCGADIIQGYHLGKPAPADEICDIFYAAGTEPLTHAKSQQRFMDKQLSA